MCQESNHDGETDDDDEPRVHQNRRKSFIPHSSKPKKWLSKIDYPMVTKLLSGGRMFN